MSTEPINRSKDKYKVRNGKEYNTSLCKRGSLALFLDDAVLQEWEQLKHNKERSRRANLLR